MVEVVLDDSSENDLSGMRKEDIEFKRAQRASASKEWAFFGCLAAGSA